MVAGVKRSLSEVGLPGSPSASLNAGGADFITGVPSHAQGLNLVNRYHPESCTYNLKMSNTRRFRAAVGKAYAGIGNAHLLFPGDSDTDAYDGLFDQLGAWPIIFRNELGVPSGGDGWVKAANFGATPDPRYTTTGTWTRTGALWAASTNLGDSITLKTTKDCTRLEVYSFDGTGQFHTISVNGAVSGSRFANVTIRGGTFTFPATVLTGFFPAGTLVKVTQSTATAIAFLGINCTSSTGLHIHNFSQYGWKAQDWATLTGWNNSEVIMEEVIAPGVPDCIFQMIGPNDLSNGRTVPQITADIQTFRNRYAASDYVLLVPPHASGIATVATWQSLAGAYYQVADILDCPLVDTFDLFGQYTIANANGIMADTVHPNKGGQRELGIHVANIFGDTNGALPSTSKTPSSRAASRAVWR